MRGHVRKRRSTRTGKTSWQVLVKTTDPATGKARQLTGTRPTKETAERLLNELLYQAGRSSTLGATATVNELLDQWLGDGEGRWSPSTSYHARLRVEKHVRPRIGKMKVAKVRPVDIGRILNETHATGLKASTVKRLHTDLSSTFAWALRMGWITTNPARAELLVLPTDAAPFEAVPPLPAEVRDLVAAAEALDPDWATYISVKADAGGRRAEIVALRWSDLELDALTDSQERRCALVQIERALADGGPGVGIVEKATKTRTKRQIVLGHDTTARLAAHRARCAARALLCGVPLPEDGYVFSLEADGSKPWRVDWPTKRWGRLRAELGLDKVRLHDLRHFVATYLLDAGVDDTQVAARLGHAKGAQTTRMIYAHRLAAADERSAELLAAIRSG